MNRHRYSESFSSPRQNILPVANTGSNRNNFIHQYAGGNVVNNNSHSNSTSVNCDSRKIDNNNKNECLFTSLDDGSMKTMTKFQSNIVMNSSGKKELRDSNLVNYTNSNSKTTSNYNDDHVYYYLNSKKKFDSNQYRDIQLQIQNHPQYMHNYKENIYKKLKSKNTNKNDNHYNPNINSNIVNPSVKIDSRNSFI